MVEPKRAAKGGVIAIDGKTIRGSANAKHKAYHVVSAFAVENQLTLGEICVDEKSNEIKAVPELLDLVDVKGGIVTADAMGCQRDIARKIRDKKADYVLALKENQPTLYEDVKLWFDNEAPSPSIKDTAELRSGSISSKPILTGSLKRWIGAGLRQSEPISLQ